jgi:hypothetical protein
MAAWRLVGHGPWLRRRQQQIKLDQAVTSAPGLRQREGGGS